MSVLQTVYNHLKAKGFTTYLAGQAKTEVAVPRVVVKDIGVSQVADFSSTRALYDILCYVPLTNYTDLDPYVQSVKAAMKELQPMLMPTYNETPAYPDDTVKGWMISVEYRNYRKID